MLTRPGALLAFVQALTISLAISSPKLWHNGMKEGKMRINGLESTEITTGNHGAIEKDWELGLLMLIIHCQFDCETRNFGK